jgi:hypothetical protein
VKRLVLLLSAVTLAVGVLAGAVQSARAPTACGLLKANEYRQVLGKPVTISAGEGALSCNVYVGRSPRTATAWIVPIISPYGGFVTRLYNHVQGLQRISALGSSGAVFAPDERRVIVYFQRHRSFVVIQGERGVTRQQVLTLARIAYRRL